MGQRSETSKAPTPRLYTVAAGSTPTTCAGPTCGARIFWLIDGTRRIPVDCDAVIDGVRAPSETAFRDQLDFLSPNGLADVHDGRGVNHFETCPDAHLFHRVRERPGRRK